MYNIKAKFGINVKEQRTIWRKNVQLAGIFGKTDVQIKGKAWTQYCHLQVNWTQDVKISREVWKHNVHMKIVYFTVFRTCTYPVSGGDWPFKERNVPSKTFKNL